MSVLTPSPSPISLPNFLPTHHPTTTASTPRTTPHTRPQEGPLETTTSNSNRLHSHSPTSNMAAPDRAALHLYRHAQGIHNLGKPPLHDIEAGKSNDVLWLLYNVSGELITDPVLTVAGMNQCEELYKGLSETKTNELAKSVFVISPYKRNLQSVLLMFGAILEKAENKFIVVDPSIQEGNPAPCNEGSTTDELVKFLDECLKFDDKTSEVTSTDLKDAFYGAGFQTSGDQAGLANERELRRNWLEKGWVTADEDQRHGQGEYWSRQGKSLLGEKIQVREFSRRLSKYPGLKDIKLLIAGQEIKAQDWTNKKKRVYGADVMKYWAPYPIPAVERMQVARRNMGTKWACYNDDFKEQHPGDFKGFDPTFGIVGIIHAGILPALPGQWGMFRLPDTVLDSPRNGTELMAEITEKCEPGTQYKLPRLNKPVPYGYWDYNRGDALNGEQIEGFLVRDKKTKGFRVEEGNQSLTARETAHVDFRQGEGSYDDKTFGWFSDEQNEKFERLVLPVLSAACNVLSYHLGDALKDKENALSVEIGETGPTDKPDDWKWFVGGKKIGYTIGAAKQDDPTLYTL